MTFDNGAHLKTMRGGDSSRRRLLRIGWATRCGYRNKRLTAVGTPGGTLLSDQVAGSEMPDLQKSVANCGTRPSLVVFVMPREAPKGAAKSFQLSRRSEVRMAWRRAGRPSSSDRAPSPAANPPDQARSICMVAMLRIGFGYPVLCVCSRHTGFKEDECQGDQSDPLGSGQASRFDHP